MKVQVNDAPKSQKEISVEIPYDTFVKASDIECERIGKNTKIAGFRTGKAPKDVVMKQHLHQIRSGALENVINEAIKQAFILNEINAISQPTVSSVNLEEDKPITFKVYVDVFPQFEVKNYKGYSFDRTKIIVTDNDVDNMINNLKEQFIEYKPIAKKRKVKEGDQVNIDFEGKIDGVPFDGGKAEKFNLNIGSKQFIPGFEDQIIGMSVGETRDIEVNFPEDYHAADLAGKPCVFTIVLHEIKEKVEPELNDAFAKKANPRANNMEELREIIKKDLQYEADQYVKFDTFTRILNKLIEENEFEVPASVIDEQTTRLAQQNMQQYYQMGINPEVFGMTIDSMKEQFLEEATSQVKRAILINRIADEHKFTAEEKDLDAEITKIAEISGKDKELLKKEIANSRNMQNLQNDIVSDKVYIFLCNENSIKETEMTREDFEKAEKEKAEKEKADKSSKTTKSEKASKAKTEKSKEEPAGKTAKPSAKKAPAKKSAAKAEEAEEKPKKTAAKKPAAKKTETKKD